MLVEYDLPGGADYQKKLYPPPDVLDNPISVYYSPSGEPLTKPREVSLTSYEDVVGHYTLSSLCADGIRIRAGSLQVLNRDGKHTVRFETDDPVGQQYATMHPRLLDEDHAGQAISGVEACKATPGAWNPMAGFHVNRREVSDWALFLPLGMPMVNQRAVTLLHYPPYVAMQSADYLHNMTLQRWQNLLKCVGLEGPEHWLYDTFLDVNPIAAPGSGESEYPNDYFPIMLASTFFDDEKGNRNYIRSMLDILLNPEHNDDNPFTLPLLVGGSPLYDPQAPGWFRVRYKEHMPKDAHGIPQANVMQAGLIRISPDSEKMTPYMIANHMIAAGVTGLCTSDPSKIPDIRRYEAEDLVAVEFLRQYAADPGIAPERAREIACLKWFGNKDGTGAPNPQAEEKKKICIMALIDLFFDEKKVAPVYSWEEAERLAETKTKGTYSPCGPDLAPKNFIAEVTTYTRWQSAPGDP